MNQTLLGTTRLAVFWENGPIRPYLPASGKFYPLKRVLGMRYWVLGTSARCWVRGNGDWGTGYCIRGTGYGVLGTGDWVRGPGTPPRNKDKPKTSHWAPTKMIKYTSQQFLLITSLPEWRDGETVENKLWWECQRGKKLVQRVSSGSPIRHYPS